MWVPQSFPHQQWHTWLDVISVFLSDMACWSQREREREVQMCQSNNSYWAPARSWNAYAVSVSITLHFLTFFDFFFYNWYRIYHYTFQLFNYFGILHLLNILVILQATWHRRFFKNCSSSLFWVVFVIKDSLSRIQRDSDHNKEMR